MLCLPLLLFLAAPDEAHAQATCNVTDATTQATDAYNHHRNGGTSGNPGNAPTATAAYRVLIKLGGNLPAWAGTEIADVNAPTTPISEAELRTFLTSREDDWSGWNTVYTALNCLEAHLPVVTITGGAAVTEGVSARFTVSVNPVPSSPLRVNLNVTDAAGSDFVPLFNEGMQTVTIPLNHTSAVHTVRTVNDGIDEPNGPVTVTVAGGSGYRLGAAATATVTVNDNDEPGPESQVQFSRETFIIAEFGPQYRTVVEIADGARTAGYDRIVNYTVGGSAERGDGKDYTIDGCSSSTCSVRLRANSHSVAINLNINTDSIDEGDETIVLTLQDGSGYTLNDKNTLTMTLIDDDTRGLDFRRRSAYVDEGGSGTYTVKLASQPTAAVTVKIASDNPDVTVSPTSLTFNPTGNTELWSRAQTVTVSVADDNDAVDDTATLTHTTSGGDYGGDNALSIGRPVIVEDDDTGTTVTPQLPRISLTGGAAVTEGGDASFTVNANPAPTSSLTVSVEVFEPPGQDFLAASEERVRTVTLNAGATSTTFTVPTVDDSTDEDDSYVEVLVNDGTGYIAGQGAAVTVRDDDNPIPSAFFRSASSSAAEDDGTRNVNVHLTRPAPSGGLALRYSVSGTATAVGGNDFTIQNSGTVSIAAGAASAAIPIAINDDGAAESAETVILTLIGGTGYTVGSPSVHTLTISDTGSKAILSVSAPAIADEGDAGTSDRYFTVSLSKAPSRFVSWRLCFTGTATIDPLGGGTIPAAADYQAISGQTPIDLSDKSPVCTDRAFSPPFNSLTNTDVGIRIKGDTEPEPNETVIATLSIDDGPADVDLGTSAVTYTIRNDDDLSQRRTASFASGFSSADESVGTHNVRVELSGAAPSGGLTLSYSVAAPQRWAPTTTSPSRTPARCRSRPGETYANIPITVNNDRVEDDRETVILTLSDGTGYTVGSPSVHTFTITNTEAPVVSFGPATTPPDGRRGRERYRGRRPNRDRADQVEPRAGVRHHDRLQRHRRHGRRAVATATSPSPIRAASRSRRASPGQTSPSPSTTTVMDQVPAETIILTLQDGTGYELDQDPNKLTYTVRIADDDSAGVDVSESALELVEGGRVKSYTVTLESEPEDDVTVTLTSADAGAVRVNRAGDSPASSATLTFTTDDWSKGQVVTVTAQEDDDGDDETVTIAHRVTGYVAGVQPDDVTVTVLDDGTPRVYFSTSASRLRETSTTGYATQTDDAACAAIAARVELSSASDSPIDLVFAVRGTATVGTEPFAQSAAGTDYAMPANANLNLDSLKGRITIPAGRKCAVIPMTVNNDARSEGNESVILTLEAGVGANSDYTVDASRNRHTVTIEDNDGGVLVQPATLELTEGGENGEYTVRLTSDPGRNVTVVPSTPDPGAVAVSGFLVFGGGSSGNWRQPQTIIVSPIDDADARDETVTISHSIIGYGDAKVPDVTVAVTDDDAAAASPVVTINASGGSVDEGGIAEFVLTATPRPLANITVNVQVESDGDFAASGETGSRPVALGAAGQATLTVSTRNDETDEPDGAITATIVNGQNYTVATPPSHAASVAVRDDDDPPPPASAVSFLTPRSSAAEHDGTLSVTIQLDPPPATTIPLTYITRGTADPDSDYTLHNANAVAAPAGQASVRIPVTIKEDRLAEPNETLIFELVAGDGYTVDSMRDTFTLTITDNDSLGVTVAPRTLSLEEGRTGSYTVVLDTDPGDGARVTVTPSVSDPGAVVISPQSLTFDTRNWSIPQRVNVSGGDDDDDDNEAVTISHTVSGYGNGVTANPVAVEVIDDDYREPVVNISGGGEVVEGQPAVFTLTAVPPPSRRIVVNVSVESVGDFAHLGQDGSRLVPIEPNGRGVLSVATQDDSVEEAEGSIRASIGVGDGYGVALPPDHAAAVPVADNDAPPAISVASFASGASEASEAPETGDATRVHRVNVSLVPAAETAFTLRYTVSGTATPGEDGDYTFEGVGAGVGEIDGETVRATAVPLGASSVDIVVEIRDDDSYDPGEQVVFDLIEGRDYEVGAEPAHTLSIIDDDRASGLQIQAEATVARLGRSLSEQWLQGVSDRLSARRRAAEPTVVDDPFQLAIAGRTDWFDPEAGWRTRGLALPPGGPAAPPPPAGTRPVGAPPVGVVGVSTAAMQDRPAGGSAAQPAPGSAPPGTEAAPPGSADGGAPAEGDDDSGGRFRNALRGIFSNSSFLARGPRLAGGSVGFWGQGARATVGGGADQFSMDADMTSTLLGADWTGVWLTMGLMVSHGSGDGNYTAGNVNGEVDLTLTGLTPYVGYQWGDRTSIWGALNASGGELSLRPDDRPGDSKVDADLSTLAFAAGGRSEMYAGAQGLSLSVLADVLAVNTETGSLDGGAGVDAGANRLRISLEGAWSRALPGAGRIRTHLEAGLRGDGGDAEEGFGAEVAAGVSWNTGGGLTVELAGRGLAVHADEEFEHSGASFYVAWDPSPDTPLGPTLSMRQGRGDTGGAGRLQASSGLAVLGAGAVGGGSATERTDLELGWGVPWRKHRYVLTPSVSHGRVGVGGRETGVGWRLEPGELNGLDLSAALRAAWREQSAGGGPGGSDADRSLAMDVRVRW